MYDAFGQIVTSAGNTYDPYLFAGASGYRNDQDAGLVHVGARYYDAQAGRFVTRDTELDQHPHLYCEHGPVHAVAPGGHDRHRHSGSRSISSSTGCSLLLYCTCRLRVIQ